MAIGPIHNPRPGRYHLLHRTMILLLDLWCSRQSMRFGGRIERRIQPGVMKVHHSDQRRKAATSGIHSRRQLQHIRSCTLEPNACATPPNALLCLRFQPYGKASLSDSVSFVTTTKAVSIAHNRWEIQGECALLDDVLAGFTGLNGSL